MTPPALTQDDNRPTVVVSPQEPLPSHRHADERAPERADPLFTRGVDTIGGRRVVDAKGFRDAFCKGQKWGSFAGKYVITRQDYPGLDWLLDRTG